MAPEGGLPEILLPYIACSFDPRYARNEGPYTARVFGVSCVRAIQRAPYCPDHDLLVAVTKQELQNSDYTLGILLGTL